MPSDCYRLYVTKFGMALIAQAVFLLECGQPDRQTNIQMQLNAVPTPAAMPAWVTTVSINRAELCKLLQITTMQTEKSAFIYCSKKCD